MRSNRSARRQLSGKCRPIRMVIMDLDGVLTDGRIMYGDNGSEYKAFDAHDGYGIERAARNGLLLGIVSGRSSKAAVRRAQELGVTEVHQGVKDKTVIVNEMTVRYGLKREEVCFIGDDEPDVPVLETVGLSAAPEDAPEEVRKLVDYVAAARGGCGAVREILDLILRAKKLI